MLTAIGLMSGTSADGIDAALIETDGHSVAQLGAHLTLPYSDAARRDIRRAYAAASLDPLGDPEVPFADMSQKLADWHSDAVHKLLAISGLTPEKINIIGFHGQTILHRPDLGRTWQVGDAARLAKLTGIDVMADFRSQDVASGGEGAPLAPLYHAALVAGARRAGILAEGEAVAVLNLGGVGNVTWIGPGGEDNILAFDTGPGNALIDDWMLAKTGTPCDIDGSTAARGRVDEGVVGALMTHDYFARPAPKSLDRHAFNGGPWGHLDVADGAATLAEFTVQAVAAARRHFPSPAARWLVCGGGRHNPGLMARLEAALKVNVAPVEALGWRGDALEAEAFGFLAVRALKDLPLSLPTTTGVPRPMSGGRLFKASR